VVESANVPAAHISQDTAPAAEILPDEHATHESGLSAPACVEKVPASQTRQWFGVEAAID